MKTKAIKKKTKCRALENARMQLHYAAAAHYVAILESKSLLPLDHWQGTMPNHVERLVQRPTEMY